MEGVQGPCIIIFILFYFLRLEAQRLQLDEFEWAKKQVPTGLSCRKSGHENRPSVKCLSGSSQTLNTQKTMLPSSQVVLLLHTHSAYQIRREGKRKKGEGEEVERWPWICLRFRVEYWEGTMAHGRADGPTLWCCPNKISMIFGWRYCGTLA